MYIFAADLELHTIIEGALYAIQWQKDLEDDILEEMSEAYNDAQYLNQYFNENAEKLKFYKNPTYSPQDAAVRTQKEADALIQEIKELATQGLQGYDKSLDDLFERLHTEDAIYHPRYYTDVKAKGYPGQAPWVRVYAVKCDENLYVITGYAIKLVRDMRHDPDLQQELVKLKKATEYLESIQMISK